MKYIETIFGYKDTGEVESFGDHSLQDIASGNLDFICVENMESAERLFGNGNVPEIVSEKLTCGPVQLVMPWDWSREEVKILHCGPLFEFDGEAFSSEYLRKMCDIFIVMRDEAEIRMVADQYIGPLQEKIREVAGELMKKYDIKPGE